MTALRNYLIVILLLWPAAVSAQPDTTVSGSFLQDTVLTLPDVTVEDLHYRGNPAAASRHLTVLDTAVIEQLAVSSVAGLLERRSGLFIKRYGADGLATASLRGTSSNQTIVLIDGQRAADPQTGQIDLSLLPTVLLESVEVLHGASSARYGSGGMGGVVQLHTLQPREALRLRTVGEFGAFGRRRAGTVLSGKRGLMYGMTAVELTAAEGDFPYVNETLVPPQPVRREEADRTMQTVFGKAGYRSSQQHLGVTGWYSDAERGLPGMGHAPAQNARQGDRHLRLMSRYHRRTARGGLHLSGRWQETTRRYAFPAADEYDTTRTRNYELEAGFERLAGSRWMTRGGVEVGGDHANLRGGVQRMRLGTFLTGFGEYPRLRLHPALRLDAYLSPGRNVVTLSPQLGLNVQPLPWQELRLKGHIGRAFRAPTFGERFYRPGGNPNLKAEKGWSAETGTLLQTKRGRTHLTAEVTLFGTWIRDQVVWYPSFAGPGLQVWRPSNVARVVSRGLETSLQGMWTPARERRLEGGLYFTHTDARSRANPKAPSFDRQLRYVPRQQLKLHLGATWHRLRLDLSARLVGRRFITSDETQALPPYRVVDAHLRYARRLGPVQATFGLLLENAVDADYSIIRFYPMPPRHLRIRLILETAT